MGRRKKNDLASDLIALPWQVSAVIALGSFACIRWVLPSVLPSNSVLSGIRFICEPLSWIALFGFSCPAVAAAIRAKSQPVKSTDRPLRENQKHGLNRTIIQAGTFSEVTRDAQKYKHAQAVTTQKTAAPTEWSLEALRTLEWKRFELLCAKYYDAVDFQTETLQAGPDGGIDIKLFKIDLSRPLAVIQCKAWNTQRVGVKEIRELLGVMVHERVSRGIFITSGTYTQEAIAFGSSNPIQLLDGNVFIQKILDLPIEKQNELFKFAFEGDFRSPTCASCGIKLIPREGKRGPFWGCLHYPRCKTTLPMRA